MLVVHGAENFTTLTDLCWQDRCSSPGVIEAPSCDCRQPVVRLYGCILSATECLCSVSSAPTKRKFIMLWNKQVEDGSVMDGRARHELLCCSGGLSMYFDMEGLSPCCYKVCYNRSGRRCGMSVWT